MPQLDLNQAAPRDTLWFDPDTGDTHCLMWDAQDGIYRLASAEDVIEDFVRRHEPLEVECEFDVPGH